MNMDANATADPGPKKIDECVSYTVFFSYFLYVL